MNALLENARENIARDRLARFDFGTPRGSVGEWVETTRDALSCTVRLGQGGDSRSLTFRVVFEPRTSRVRDIEIGERLPLL